MSTKSVRRQWRSLLSSTALLLMFSACQASNPPAPRTADAIIQRMRQAPMKDATFVLQTSLDLGGERGQGLATIRGNGKLTIHPKQVALLFTATGLGSNAGGEVITDETHTYARNSNQTNWDIHSIDQASYINRGDFLRYDLLQEIKLVSDADPTTWHLTARPPLTALTPIGDDGAPTLVEDLWIDQKTFLPHIITIKGSGRASVPDAHGQQILTNQSIATMITFTQWNSGLTIMIPAV